MAKAIRNYQIITTGWNTTFTHCHLNTSYSLLWTRNISIISKKSNMWFLGPHSVFSQLLSVFGVFGHLQTCHFMCFFEQLPLDRYPSPNAYLRTFARKQVGMDFHLLTEEISIWFLTELHQQGVILVSGLGSFLMC